MRKYVIGLISIVAAAAFPLNAKQDFEKSYPVVPKWPVIIRSMVGDITVSGYKGKEIKVIASKEGPDKDKVEIIEKRIGPTGIELSPKFFKFGNDKTKVDFEVKVPESDVPAVLELRSVSGTIEVSNVKWKGTIVVKGIRGDVKISDVEGDVSVRSESGQIDVKIKNSETRRKLWFDSGSGNIKVTAPSNLQAWIDMKSISGNINTDFPLSTAKSHYGGHIAHGILGSGNQKIFISSTWGSVSLLKK